MVLFYVIDALGFISAILEIANKWSISLIEKSLRNMMRVYYKYTSITEQLSDIVLLIHVLKLNYQNI